MFRPSRTGRLMLHVANLMVIFFILLPLAAVFVGSVQSEKSLQADTHRLLPIEFTADNFIVILSKGEHKGRIFEQVTYLPDNIKSFSRSSRSCSARCRPTPSRASAFVGPCFYCRPTSWRVSCR